MVLFGRLRAYDLLGRCAVFATKAVISAAVIAGVTIGRAEPASVNLTVESGHPWTPPFGLDRVGRPLEAVVEVPGGAVPGDIYVVSGYRDERETSRREVRFIDEKLNFLTTKSEPRYRFGRVILDDWPGEVVLWRRQEGEAEWSEVARTEVCPPPFEVEAQAQARESINPVDLGAILPPANWLLLESGREAEVKIAALSCNGQIHGAKVSGWFDSAPDQKVSADLVLSRNERVLASLVLRATSRDLKKDLLHVAVVDGAGREMWQKDIHTMLVPDAP